jgi:hypothetical protein
MTHYNDEQRYPHELWVGTTYFPSLRPHDDAIRELDLLTPRELVTLVVTGLSRDDIAEQRAQQSHGPFGYR